MEAAFMFFVCKSLIFTFPPFAVFLEQSFVNKENNYDLCWLYMVYLPSTYQPVR